MCLTESHLSPNIQESEVYIEGWQTIRSDRSNRQGGGVIVYINDHMAPSFELSHDNDTCNIVNVYISEIDTAIMTIYRPPDCKYDKFNQAMIKCNEWMKNLENKIEHLHKIVIIGDLNFPFMGDWNSDSIEKLAKNIDKRVEKDMNISDVKLQAELLLIYTRKFLSTQKVNEVTRDRNILDFIFDNDNIVKSI